MPRPILDERMTIRIPAALLEDCFGHVTRMKFPSLNEFVLNSLENELARLGTYHIDYYNDFRPLLNTRQGDKRGHCRSMSDRGPRHE